MSNTAGKLYVVATPIGNLEDITPRALHILGQVDLIAAEDTRHSGRLLKHYGIERPLRAYHDFNERDVAGKLVAALQSGSSIALISDAGTPMIADPGYRLVGQAREHGIEVIAVPGPSAVTAALSIAGLPTDRFVFEGYAPANAAKRRRWLQGLAGETRTVVFYETPHRIQACLADTAAALGEQREAVLARELTKQFEQVCHGNLAGLLEQVQNRAIPAKGEFVVLVRGAAEAVAGDHEAGRLLALLLEELPVKHAAALAARITGRRKNELYQLALQLVRREE